MGMVGAVARVHGYEPAAITPTTKPILSQKHPDDRAHIAHTLHAIRTTGGAFGSRHRIIDTAGTIRSVVVVGDRITDDHGTIVGSTGFYIDITNTLDAAVSDTVDDVVAASRGAIE
ncbi:MULTISPECIES: PAS domain-containing protein [Rhodococcus]|uniref:PAS domain-containing protein n=2 Tax=Rhodococcus TaxID=1827 RepID=A0AB38RPK6_RHOSG|nr:MULTISPECIES: PAS domain-containing protein [Rhodococcus]UPU46846.1 PAS domain-containing protein [Rhodococcus qingshengii JCM 15477]